jgi:ABC-type microcin C transport system permease subunit YejB
MDRCFLSDIVKVSEFLIDMSLAMCLTALGQFATLDHDTTFLDENAAQHIVISYSAKNANENEDLRSWP